MLANCNLQNNSPLFNKIPAEIRNQIFEYALAEYEDDTRRYAFESYHYRPGLTCRRKIDWQLLLTCKRIWLETRVLPASLAEHVWWLGFSSRFPPGSSIPILQDPLFDAFDLLHIAFVDSWDRFDA
jgi:hypothetical protein